MFVKFMTGSSRFNSMLKEAEKASNRSKNTIKTKDKVIYQVTSDSIIDALGKRGSYAISYIPIQKRTSLFGKPLSKEKCFVIEESGHPEKISKIFRAHEIGHLEANHRDGARIFSHEVEADRKMVEMYGKKAAIGALQYIQNTAGYNLLDYGRFELVARQLKILFSRNK